MPDTADLTKQAIAYRLPKQLTYLTYFFAKLAYYLLMTWLVSLLKPQACLIKLNLKYTNFIAFSQYRNNIAGQVFVFFILTVAAVESAIGLAILVVLFRNRKTIDVQQLDSLKG